MGEPVATPYQGKHSSSLPNAVQRERRRRYRKLTDHLSRYGIGLAGFGVVFALALIFIYLIYEVLPVFRGASLSEPQAVSKPADLQGSVTDTAIERYQELAMLVTDQAEVSFVALATGTERYRKQLPLPGREPVTATARGETNDRLYSLGLASGEVLLFRPDYTLSYPDDQRYIEPAVVFPTGPDWHQVTPRGTGIEQLAVQASSRGASRFMVVAYDTAGAYHGLLLTQRENMLTGEVSVQKQTFSLPELPGTPTRLLVDKELRSLFVATREGQLHYVDIRQPDHARLLDTQTLAAPITAAEFLVGTVSIITGTEAGELSQWFLVRDDDNNHALQRIRDFQPHSAPITQIASEYNRKGFLVGDAAGHVGVHYGTSARTLLQQQAQSEPVTGLAISPLNQRVLTQSPAGDLKVAELWNQHPQISWSALWQKVWYEGRSNPEYIWQSSSASDEFESKFSLVPLSVGTLKAAFYAMLFAMPLAVMGAVYSAYFMTPKLRGVVKPTIEIMEALPTVILGFLAGLWLAPFMERNLPAVFALLLGLPLVMLVMAVVWRWVPALVRDKIPAGWEAVILLPVLLLVGALVVQTGPWLEVVLFDGSMRQWLTEQGVAYDQRNALVVGVAMGFAIIPTIYSITEDAVFNVPKHLTQGSLALGATPWQTVLGVVLPTASPGIFSAIMIGFGRAVGETMIVLMATGNSPIVNFNIFEGMRTLSANIAVELPETAVGSSHFRILFLAALVLLTFTFVLNTIAEVVRQRLRRRYSHL